MNSGLKINTLKFGVISSLSAWAFGLFSIGNVFAIEPINRNSEGVALKGYDAVAYFAEGKPIMGKKEFEFQWMGVKWYFSSAANRTLFINHPESYAPQYGGYCAYAVSKGHTADISPKAWKIVDNKLYLNNGVLAESLWGRNIPDNIEKANKNWPLILGQKSTKPK